MSNEWITDRLPTKEDADYGDVHIDGYVFTTDKEMGTTRIATWQAAAYEGPLGNLFFSPSPM